MKGYGETGQGSARLPASQLPSSRTILLLAVHRDAWVLAAVVHGALGHSQHSTEDPFFQPTRQPLSCRCPTPQLAAQPPQPTLSAHCRCWPTAPIIHAGPRAGTPMLPSHSSATVHPTIPYYSGLLPGSAHRGHQPTRPAHERSRERIRRDARLPRQGGGGGRSRPAPALAEAAGPANAIGGGGGWGPSTRAGAAGG